MFLKSDMEIVVVLENAEGDKKYVWFVEKTFCHKIIKYL
jgi:hypothetical protein